MYCAGISIDCVSASLAMARMWSYFFACSARGAGIARNVSITPSARAASNASWLTASSFVELEHAHGVLAQELRPYVIAERHRRHLREDALERQTHREVTGVHHLVGTTRVRVVDDVLRIE